MPEGVGLLVSKIDFSVFVVLFIGEKLQDRLDANDLIRKVCKIINGGGGGNKVRAEGGGTDILKIPEMLKSFPEILKEKLK
jgi:alanyl-tRNA synthetase